MFFTNEQECIRKIIEEFAYDGSWLDEDDLEELDEKCPDGEDLIDYYLHGHCEEWVLENFQSGDIAIIWNEFDEDIGKVALIHCYIQRGDVFLDVRGETDDEELVEEGFEYGYENGKVYCKTLEEYKEVIRDICGYEEMKWQSGHKAQAVVADVLDNARGRAGSVVPCEGLNKDMFEKL